MTEPYKNDPDLLNSGKGAGLLYFFDIMIKRNEVNKSTGGAFRTASRKYLELEDDADGVDLRNIDFDSMNRRFVNRYRVELNDKSLETYAYRFRQATEMYLNFLDGKDWNNIKTRAAGTKTRTNGFKPPKTETPSAEEPRHDTPAPPPLPGRMMIPVPLRPGRRALLDLPEDLTDQEAEKVGKVVAALASGGQLMTITAGALED